MEFTPQSVDIFLLVVDTCEFHHVEAGSGMCTIRTDQEIEVNRDLFWALFVLPEVLFLGGVLRMVNSFGITVLLEPGYLFVKVGTCELVIEVQCGVRQFLQRI